MAEMTANVFGVVLDKWGGLRRMADEINLKVSELYRHELAATANIVAVDYLRGTSIVETAINWNKNKFSKK